jgi:alkylated DNA repair dioxygenase AlkB
MAHNNKDMSDDVIGLTYTPNFLTETEEAALVAAVDAEPWITELKRRVQHYGHRYDYRGRTAEYLGPLPAWAEAIAAKCTSLMPEFQPDQLIVNEYIPPMGIAQHTDAKIFGDVIVTVSLLSDITMVFRRRGAEVPIRLERRSAAVMAGAARREWTHEIPARKTDSVDGMVVPRGRRMSLTFRKVVDF